MRSDSSNANSDSRFYYSQPWRYCEYCGMCHKDMIKCCKPEGNERKREYYGDSGRYEDIRPYRQPERDDWRQRDDPYEPDEQERKERNEKKTERREDDTQNEKSRPDYRKRPYKQSHVHEFQGSVKLAEFDEDVHNHRVAGISGEVIKTPGGHIHKIWTRTDFFDHFHYIQQTTGPAIYLDHEDDVEAQGDATMIDEEPHVHFVTGSTTINDGHSHEFQFATLIDSPLLPGPEAE